MMEVVVLVVMQKHTLMELTLHNEFPEHKPGSFQIKPQINFTVFPKKDNLPIVGELTIEVGSMDDNSPLYIKVRVRGSFINLAKSESDALIDAKEFHKQCFPLIFNVTSSIVSGAMLMGGMTPINLPPIDPNRLNFEKKE